MYEVCIGVAGEVSWLDVEGRSSADGSFATRVSWTGIGRETIPVTGGIGGYGCEEGRVLWGGW